MGIISNIKAAFTPAKYFRSLIQEMNGISRGPKPRPYNSASIERAFHSWAYAAAWMNATAFASTPKRLYARKRVNTRKLYETKPVDALTKRYFSGIGQTRPSNAVMAKVAAFGGDFEEVVEPHPALLVLQNANPFFNGFELEVLKMLDLQTTGDAYWHPVVQASGQPTEVWRMPPQNTRIVPSNTNFIERYIFGIPGQERSFAVDEVIQFKMPNPFDNFNGRGWFQAAWSALGLNDSKRELDTAKFDNFARPDWLLSVPSGKAEAMDKMEEKLTAKFKGEGRERTQFLAISADVKAQALQWDVPEVGTATRVIEEIAAVSGVPVSMLLSNDASYAGSMAARQSYFRNTIQPYCRLDEEKLNERWIPLFDGSDDMFIAHDPASFEDQEAESIRVTSLVSGGILTPNEGRNEMGYPPHPDGDELYAPRGATGGGSVGGMNNGTNNGNDTRATRNSRTRDTGSDNANAN